MAKTKCFESLGARKNAARPRSVRVRGDRIVRPVGRSEVMMLTDKELSKFVQAWGNGQLQRNIVDLCRDVANAQASAERERCAKIVDLPPGTEAWEVIGGEEGLTMLRELAAQIRGA